MLILKNIYINKIRFIKIELNYITNILPTENIFEVHLLEIYFIKYL